ncbi:hypothetical protein RBB77_23175 [Tunturibacter psychrotolerans]|uniref:DUF3073 family protein n=1 Tax=Tunturiibacter psychrotolerans TaxID=3069686 RepID=A0AAU7ZQR3_9BACT
MTRTSDSRRDKGKKHRIAEEGSARAAANDRQAEDEIAQGLYQTLEDGTDLEGNDPRMSFRPST